MFKLQRYFSIASLVSITVAAAALGAFYRHVAVADLLTLGQRNNVELTQVLSNTSRASFRPLIDPAAAPASEAERAAILTALRAKLIDHVDGLSIVKVKIYDLAGLTVYSSEPRQIGEDKSANGGFLSARAGQPVSELTHRDTFSAFEQTIENRDLLSSYVPVLRADGTVEAVFEVYDDLTPALRQVDDTQKTIVMGVAAVLLALYGVLFLIVRRADRILREQHAAQKTAEERLRQARDTLEERVKERTAQLETANAGLHAEVGERRRAEAALIEAKHAAEAANAAKSQFLANVSHELRTPLNAVIGMTDLLLDTTLDAEQREHVGIVHSSGEALLGIINDILDVSKIEAGKLELDAANFRLHELVREAIATFAAPVRDKHLELHVSIDAAVPRTVRGDAGRVRQVLTNLVGNAVKFTSRGCIEVRVELAKSTSADRNADSVRFVITDTGIGISADTQARLFQPFVQGDGSMTRQYGGTGLGLAIGKQLVEMMGGTIGVESEPGRGSRFWFAVRLEKAACITEDMVAKTESADQAGGRSARVLLVEDNAVNQQVAVAMLQKLGCAVDVAADGQQALDAEARATYDLIFMDCQMPVMDGFATTRAIREREAQAMDEERRARRIPIVAMTANALQEDRERCLRHGMDDYLAKPFRQQQLKAMLERWLPRLGGDSMAPALSPS